MRILDSNLVFSNGLDLYANNTKDFVHISGLTAVNKLVIVFNNNIEAID